MKNNLFKINLISIFLLLFACINLIAADNNNNSQNPAIKIFSKEDIQKLADAYVRNNLQKENPVFIDMENRGVFDMLVFNHGVVEYYRNNGTLEAPIFVLENSHYDKYEAPPILKTGMPMPIFFADTKGTGKLDMFAVKQLDFKDKTNKYNYRILYAENSLSLGTGTLITIILILVIVLLILAIVHR